MIFFLLLGALVPSFSDYLYYYLIDVAGFSKFQYSLIQVVSNACLFLGTILYNWCLKDQSTRFMMVIACIQNFFGAGGTLLFLQGLILGINPYVFIMMTTGVTDTLYIAFVTLPSMVLFAKLIPPKIESSMFAMLTGLANLSNLFLAKSLGNFINSFVGVNE